MQHYQLLQLIAALRSMIENIPNIAGNTGGQGVQGLQGVPGVDAVLNKRIFVNVGSHEYDGGGIGALFTQGLTRTMTFSATGPSNAYGSVAIPNFYSVGNLSFGISWTPNGSVSIGGSVKWLLDWQTIQAGDNTLTAALNTIDLTHVFIAGENSDILITDQISIANIPTDKNIFRYRLRRDGSHTLDTYGSSLRFHGCTLIWP